MPPKKVNPSNDSSKKEIQIFNLDTSILPKIENILEPENMDPIRYYNHHFIEIFNSPIKNFMDKGDEKLQCKSVNIYLDNRGDDFFNKTHLKNYMINVNFDTSTTYLKAWKTVQGIRDNIVSNLYKTFNSNNLNQIELIMSTVEHTHQIPSNRKSSEIHNVKTVEEVSALYNSYKEKNEGFYVIDEIVYTENLLNYYTEMKYTANLTKPNEELLKYYEDMIEYLTPIVDAGQLYNFQKIIKENKPFYPMSKELYYAHIQTIKKATTTGYPHIHIGVWYESTFEDETLRLKIHKIVEDNSGLKDILVKKSPNGSAPTKTLKYVSKNHSVKIVYDSLKNSKCDTTIIKTIITSKKYYHELLEIIGHISTIGKFTSNENCTKNYCIAMKIEVSRDVWFRHINTENIEKSINDIKYINITNNNLSLKYINMVQRLMVEENYAICEGQIYQKIPNSKTSYEHKYSINDFLIIVSKFEKTFRVASKLKNDLAAWMNQEKNIKFHELDAVEFPRININYRMIEYKDFYYCLTTKMIYRTQTEYQTYIYCPCINLNNLNEMLNEFLNVSIYVKNMKKSGMFYIENIAILYSITEKRNNKKEGAVLIVGESNTSKSQAILPYEFIFPKSKVGRLKSLSEYHIYEQVKDKEIVIIDEVNTILRSIPTDSGRGPGLLFLGGEPVTGNKKLGEITTINSSRSGLVMTGNIEPSDEPFYQEETIINRMKILKTVRSCHEVEKYTIEAAKLECPIIMIFSGMCSVAYQYNLDYIPNIIINEKLEGENLSRLRIYNDDKVWNMKSCDENEDLFKFSRKVKKGTSIPETTPFITKNSILPECIFSEKYGDLPKYSGVTKVQILKSIDSVIQQKKHEKLMLQDKLCREAYGVGINVNTTMNVMTRKN